jgi:hypothetical protein
MAYRRAEVYLQAFVTFGTEMSGKMHAPTALPQV